MLMGDVISDRKKRNIWPLFHACWADVPGDYSIQKYDPILNSIIRHELLLAVVTKSDLAHLLNR